MSEVSLSGLFRIVDGLLTPLFLIASPVLSYGDQALSMHRNKSSAGFSLDIPLIMLVASFLKIFYWPYARFDGSLLVQALVMVVMQIALLKIALDNRPLPSKHDDVTIPFSNSSSDTELLDGSSSVPTTEGVSTASQPHQHRRPYQFWQWRLARPYWQFLLYMFGVLLALELILPSISQGFYQFYSSTIGYLGLGIEATLPIPQIIANIRTRSCHGLRVSVIGSWLAGDIMKILWFFTSATAIPWSFKLCGLFQGCCDLLLGLQYLQYGGLNVILGKV